VFQVRGASFEWFMAHGYHGGGRGLGLVAPAILPTNPVNFLHDVRDAGEKTAARKIVADSDWAELAQEGAPVAIVFASRAMATFPPAR
jgi:hypothetical protein